MMFTVNDVVSVSEASTNAKHSGNEVLSEKLSDLAQKLANYVASTIPTL